MMMEMTRISNTKIYGTMTIQSRQRLKYNSNEIVNIHRILSPVASLTVFRWFALRIGLRFILIRNAMKKLLTKINWRQICSHCLWSCLVMNAPSPSLINLNGLTGLNVNWILFRQKWPLIVVQLIELNKKRQAIVWINLSHPY